MLKIKNVIKSAAVIALLILSITKVNAQTRISSPYSRFGIGDLYGNNNARTLAMGGISTSLRNPASVNFLNPASNTGYDSASCIFEFGIYSRNSLLETGNLSRKYNYTSLGYFNIGFPVTRKWGSSIGLLPYSSVGYKITANEILDSIGNVTYIYDGDGGLNKLYFANGFQLTKGLSVGLSSNVIFGTINHTRTIDFIKDSADYFDLEVINSTILADFDFEAGLQYHTTFSDSTKYFNFGFNYHLPSSISGKYNTLVRSYKASTIIDTVENIDNKKGELVLPMGFSGGVSFGKKDIMREWLIGADFSWQNWESYESDGLKDSMKNSLQFNIGGEFVPKPSGFNYLQKVHYRIGANYGQSYLELNNTQLTQYGITFGFGFPVSKNQSTLNVGFELGSRGTTENDLLREKYGKITFGIAIWEHWFQKRKYL